MSRKGIMLCYPWDESRLLKWGFPVFVQPKLNGDRCKAYFNENGKVTLVSSEGNIRISVPHIVGQLESLRYHSLILDGELYVHGMNHSDIRSIVSRTVNLHPDHRLMEYHIFDIENDDVLNERLSQLYTMIIKPKSLPLYELDSIKEIKINICYNVQEVYETLTKFYHLGYEGIVAKNPMSIYESKRSTNWMKYKPRKSDTYKIVGFEEEIDKDGFAKGTLGALVCVSDSEEIFNVGSGFSAYDRKHLWSIRMELPGNYVRVKYQELSKDRKVPIHPVISVSPTGEIYETP